MTVQTMHLELPAALFQRVSVQAPDDARELVTFLVESYAQSLEKTLAADHGSALSCPGLLRGYRREGMSNCPEFIEGLGAGGPKHNLL